MLVKIEKGKNVGVEQKSGERCQWKAKGQSSKGVSATTTVGVEKQHNRHLLLQDRRHNVTEENVGTEKPSEAVEEGKIKKLAEMT